MQNEIVRRVKLPRLKNISAEDPSASTLTLLHLLLNFVVLDSQRYYSANSTHTLIFTEVTMAIPYLFCVTPGFTCFKNDSSVSLRFR